MVNIINKFKNHLLNRSGQYRFYKSQYEQMYKENSSSPNKMVEFETLSKQKDNDQILLKKLDELEFLLKKEDNNQILLKKLEELKAEIYPRKGGVFRNKRGKKLADIRSSHPANSIKNVTVGDFTYGNPKIERFNDNDTLTIGKFCSISKEVTILIGKGHNIQSASSYPFSSFLGTRRVNINKIPMMQCGDTIIGNDVWIGYGALILSGVTVGDGAVIGAGAVVSKDVEPYSIVVGSPLKHIRYRFPKDVRNLLVEKKWWDLPDEKIEELAPYLIDIKIEDLLERL